MNLPKILSRGLTVGLVAAGVWLGARYVLPCLAPFLAALGLAMLLQRPVGWLQRRAGLPRSVASGACVLGGVGALGWGLYALCARLIAELKGFGQRLPELLDGLMATLDSWQRWLERISGGKLTDGAVLEGVQSWLTQLPGVFSAWALESFTAAAALAPKVLLFLVTAVIGAYFVSASYHELAQFAAAQLSDKALERARFLWAQVQSTIGRWFRAQLILSLITFGELTLAFVLLGVDYALLLSLITAVVDALPVLGAGTVLVPWALYEFLAGSVERGVGLAVTYGAVTVLRSCIQAKLLGDQLGLHPLVTLLAIYVGYRVWGVWGMVLFPVLAITVKQLNDSGLVRLWKRVEKGDTNDRNSVEHSGGCRHERSGRHEYPSR